MAKRSGYFQLKQPSACKKPKLDIEIIPSQQYHPQPSTSSKPNNPSNGAVKSSADNLWDDDGDDIIVLASQAVEAFEADITFGRFSRSVKSSTQQTTEVVTTAHVSNKPLGKVPDKLVAELFADGEDDLFSEKLDDNYRNFDNAINDYFNNNDDDFNLDEFRQQEQAPLVGGRYDEPVPKQLKLEEEFKVPASVAKPSANETPSFVPKEETRPTSRIGMIFRPKTSTTQAPKVSPAPQQCTVPPVTPKIEREVKESVTQKQEKAKDIQLKFFTKRVEQLEQKLSMLQKDCNEAVEKVQVKDGEVSMLRYELKMVKTTNEQLRLEKIREKETIQKEWIEKMKNLEKTISAQKVENEFKEMEIMNLKTKRLSATMRSSELRDGTEVPTTSARSESKVVTGDSFILCTMLPKLSLTEPIERYERLHLDPQLFVNPTDSSAQGRKLRKYSRITRNEFVIADQLVLLQTCLSQLMSDVALYGGGGSDKLQLTSDKLPFVAIATEKGLNEIVLYCQRLGQQKAAELRASGTNRSSERNMQGRPRSKMELTTAVNIFQQEKLFVGEQAIVIRRFLALVALYGRISNELVVETLLKKNLVSRLAHDIKQISDASFLVALHGMITGVAALLNGMSFRSGRIKLYGVHGAQLMELFRSIVLCQTDAPSSLVELSDFLRHLSQLTDGSANHLLERLCISHQPVENKPARKQYRLKSISFSQETCTLQMYAALLESSVRHHVPYAGWQLKPLLKNTENTIHFLRNVLLHPIGWIKSFYDRSDPTGCELCHIRIVMAFVTLLHRVLLCWNQRTVRVDEDVKRIHRISQQAVLLLYDLFQTAYHKKLLRLGGHTVRYRLRAVYNWLKLYEKAFNFRPIHSTTLGMLDMRLLMCDPLRSSLETESEESEQEKKAATREDDRKAESKTIVDELFADFLTTYHNNNATLLE